MTGLMLGWICGGCQTAAPKAATWEKQLQQSIPVMGHRNWIVIADSAYPAQSRAGIETIYTGTSQLEAVRRVLAALDETGHVQPVIHLDAELEHVPEALAPGVGAYRTALTQLLQGRRVNRLGHEELINQLDRAGETFRILILKTDLMLPYTSVFLELDCGYWGPEREEKLREAISQSQAR